jgi:hypothetical protein
MITAASRTSAAILNGLAMEVNQKHNKNALGKTLAAIAHACAQVWHVP